MRLILFFICMAPLACSSGRVSVPDGETDVEDAGQDAGVGDYSDIDDGGDPGGDLGGDPAGDLGGDTGGDTGPTGQISGIIRVNHVGWRPNDRKLAVVLGHGGETIELRRASDASLAGSYSASDLVTDEDSSDTCATLDFSDHTEPGEFYLYLPSVDVRSYTFEIGGNVYEIVGQAAVKSYYYQRCNHDKALPYATDTLGAFAGIGGQWTDGACHLTDLSAPAGPGSVDHGMLDVSGGWHDAGDYQKTLWGRGVPEMLFAYEINPGRWHDAQLNIPEIGNGLPDLLDEIRWELDFYMRIQRPDGHFMSSVKGRDGSITSPPSASDEGRVYFDCTSPSGDGWSGGGVTLGQATGNAVLCLAHAAIIYRAAGQTALADGYQAAAAAGWSWLDGFSPSGAVERRLKGAAAAAVCRMDPGQISARAHADAFPFDSWDGLLPYDVTPSENVIAAGAWHTLLDPSAPQATKTRAGDGVRAALVERAFDQAGIYGGMFGNTNDGWNWGWGSNRAQASYGANLMMAAHFDILGGHTRAEVEFLAQKHFHFLLGLNPLNMLYMTNMAAYRGEHSSFQIYHSWFSFNINDGDHGNPLYNGLPQGVIEPLYPYYPDDDQTSQFGPPPGIVPGGPNWYYGGFYDIPNRDRPAYAYRDFSVGCDWDGGQCLACSWEITEPMAAYQGPFVLLASFMMGDE